MPSPLAHTAIGVVIYKLGFDRARDGRQTSRREIAGVPLLLVACLGLSLMPDLDAAVGLALRDMGKYHNNFAGSPLFGVLVSLLAGALTWLVNRPLAARALVLTLVCYETHILMDFFTVGRGVMLLWPFSSERFMPPVHLFYGLRWSDGLVSPRHLVTIFSEMAFVVVVFSAMRVLSRRRG